MTFTVTNCASCKAPIIWSLDHKTGKRCPIDAEPLAGGNIRLTEREHMPPASAVVGAAIDLFDPTDDGVRYYSHFVTCPNAKDWRKRGRPMTKEQLDTPGPKRWRTDHR